LRKDARELMLAIADTARALTVLHFPTNGWFRRRIVETCAALVARRPELQLIVTVSIDGPPPIHDRIRGREGAFERAIETFAELRAMAGVDVYLGTTLTPESEAHVEALGELLRRRFPDFSASEWHWNRLQISEHFFNNAELAGAEPQRPGLAKEHLERRGAPRSFVDAMELAFLINLEFYQRGEASGIGCQSLRSTAFVSPEGELYPCHVWDRPLGNLREHSFAELWHSRRVLDARAEVERLDCGGCFTPCEAYPALAGDPVGTIRETAKRSLRLVIAK
jgi:radical SAM protein with 4Fe4S-binding SPASM domain